MTKNATTTTTTTRTTPTTTATTTTEASDDWEMPTPTPASFLTLVSVPLLVGSVVGYRRQLAEDKVKQGRAGGIGGGRIGGRGGPGGGRGGGKGKGKGKGFNPAMHAGRALMVSTGLTLSGFGLFFGMSSYFLGYKGVDDWVNGGRRFGGSVRRGLEGLLGEERVGGKDDDERKEEEKKIRGMTLQEESQYWGERIFGKEEETDRKDGGK